MKKLNPLVAQIIEDLGADVTKKAILATLEDGQFLGDIGATQAEAEEAHDLVMQRTFRFSDYLPKILTSNLEIAADLDLWRTYADPDLTMTDQEFEGMDLYEKIDLLEECFPTQIKTTGFDFNYHSAQIAGDYLHGKYVLHNIDVYNWIVVGESQLSAVYQTGMSYDHFSYSCPSENLQLSSAGGTDYLLDKLNELSESDFNSDSEQVIDLLEEFREELPTIQTKKQLLKLYRVLNDNKPLIVNFLSEEQQNLTVEDLEKLNEGDH